MGSHGRYQDVYTWSNTLHAGTAPATVFSMTCQSATVASSADASTLYALHAERPEDIQHPLVHLHSHVPRISTSGLRCTNHRQGFAEAGPPAEHKLPWCCL